MNEEPFTSSASTTAEAYPGAPHQGGSQFQQKAGNVAQSAQEQAERLQGAVREQGAQAMDQLKSSVHSATEQAQQAGRTFIRGQQETLAQRCSEYAEAARAASEKLRADEGNMLAGPAQTAAESLERVSDYLRNHEPADLLQEVENFARRRPEVVLGGLFVIGLAASRFLKASRRHLDQPRGMSYRRQPRQFGSQHDVDYGTGAGFSEGVATGSGMGTGSTMGSAGIHPATSGSTTSGSFPSSTASSTGGSETSSTSPLWTGGTTGTTGSSPATPPPLPGSSSSNMP